MYIYIYIHTYIIHIGMSQREMGGIPPAVAMSPPSGSGARNASGPQTLYSMLIWILPHYNSIYHTIIWIYTHIHIHVCSINISTNHANASG